MILSRPNRTSVLIVPDNFPGKTSKKEKYGKLTFDGVELVAHHLLRNESSHFGFLLGPVDYSEKKWEVEEAINVVAQYYSENKKYRPIN